MENIILTLENMDAYNLCISIVAINMTIIGLTSIAESKSVIGADYSTFLIKKFRVLKYIRIYHLLIVFAAINILALIRFYNKCVGVRKSHQHIFSFLQKEKA